MSPFTDDGGLEAADISGVSCVASSGGKQVCLVIDDQGRLAQAATIEGSKLKGGGKIRVIWKGGPPADIVGKEPTVDNCSKKKDKFKDLDGEAVAHDGKSFYLVGSHGCSRKSNKFRASSFILARIPNETVVKAAEADQATVDEKGGVATTFRLSDALLSAPTVKAFFAQDLMTKQGLNIEGLGIVNGMLYAGLRAPVIGTKAYLIAVDLSLLFDSRPIGEQNVREIDIELGGRGIRDIAVLSDGRLLVLSGPAQDQTVSFALHAVEPNSKTVVPITELKEIPSAWKAEAFHILGQESAALDLLIAFDGPKSGAPLRYVVEMK